MSLICNYCEQNVAGEIEDFGQEVVRICHECDLSMAFDEYSRQRVPEIVATINGLDIGQETYDNEVVRCDWTSQEMLRSRAVRLYDSSGDITGLVHPNEDVSYCNGCDCSFVGRNEDLMWYEDDESSYCSDCYPKDDGDRWSRRITKKECDSYAKFPIDNYVGIEFEAEMPDYRSIYAYNGVQDYIAEAKHDGSLQYGTEYVSHPLQGDDILECIETMCEAFAREDFTLDDTVGWHFHYDVSRMGNKRQKKVWKAFAEFSDLMKELRNNQEIPDYGYFRRMFREYAENWSDRYRDWASQWALDTGRRKYSSTHWERNYSGSSPYRKYSFVNFEPLRHELGRIEVRMYHPDTFRHSCTSGVDDSELFEKVSKDYPSFIRFWHEFIRKAGYGRNGVKIHDEDGNGIGIKEFAKQFSTPVKAWLLQRDEDFRLHDSNYRLSIREARQGDLEDYGQALGSSWNESRED